MRGKLLGLLAAALALGLVVACAPAAPPTPTPPPKAAPEVKPPAPKLEVPTPKPEVKPPAPTFSWKLSEWGPPRGNTKPTEWWTKEVEKRTNGRFKVEMVYGEGLAKATENLDGVKAGAFEMGHFCAGYSPGKNPLITGLELPFFAPADIEVQGRVNLALFDHPAIKEEFKRWNAMLLLPGPLPPHELAGKKKLTRVEDFKGLRVRVGGGEWAKLLQEFGAVPTLVPAPEVYTALDKGLIDLTSCGWTFMCYDYKLYEISKYATDKLAIGSPACPWVVNIDAWNKLPSDFQKLALDLREGMIKEFVKQYAADDAKNYDIFRKAGVEIVDFPAGERAKMVPVAEKVWKAWVEDKEKKGLPGKEVFEFVQAKMKELEKK